MKLLILAFVSLTLVLNSCTIEKRHYRPGYHIEWKHNVGKGAAQKNDVREDLVIPVIKSVPETDCNELKIDQCTVQEDITSEGSPEIKKNGSDVLSTPAITKNKEQLYFIDINKKPYEAERCFKKKQSTVFPHSAMSNGLRLFLAILLLLFGLPFLSVLLMAGVGPEFWLNVYICLGILVFALLWAFTGIGIFSVFLFVAILAAIIHAILVMAQKS